MQRILRILLCGKGWEEVGYGGEGDTADGA